VPAQPSDREVRDFRFRRLDKPEEFRAVEEVQRLAWGLEEEPPVPSPLLRAMQDNGGLVLGGFADIHLVGFCLGFLGWDGTLLFHYSHMTAVRPEYQNHRLGFRLKAFQRDEVLRSGLPLIRWTFDPLQSKNARLNVRLLGAVPDRYYVHYYGQMGSDVNRGLESDRLRVSWEIASPRVEARMTGTVPSAAEDQARLARSKPIVETAVGDTGLRVPTTVEEPTASEVHLEIPFDIALFQEHAPGEVRRWRHAVRDGFRSAFDRSYRVDDYAVIPIEHERRGFYFLSAPSPASLGTVPS
jgi:predicted GNAT superfamily acetyltransferase